MELRILEANSRHVIFLNLDAGHINLEGKYLKPIPLIEIHAVSLILARAPKKNVYFLKYLASAPNST